MRLYGFIEAEKANYPVSLMARVLGVARSGYYAWRDREPSSKSLADPEIAEKIRVIYRASRGTYGYPGVHSERLAYTPVLPGTMRRYPGRDRDRQGGAR